MSERNYWQRMRRKRLSRRSLLSASARAGVGAAGLALVGCGDDDDDSAQQAASQSSAPSSSQSQSSAPAAADQQQQEQQAVAQAQQADDQEQQAADSGDSDQSSAAAAPTSSIQRGGVLRFSTPAATHDYFDPHRGVFGPTQYWMGLYMNYLIRWANKEQGVMESDIASLPEVPDTETYIFTLDQGASWWDQFPTEGGRTVTAEDIRANFQRQIDGADDTGAPDATFRGADRFRKTTSMDTPDEQTFVAKTTGADSTYLGGTILSPFSWITSPEGMNEWGDRWRDEATNVELSSGSGPHIPQSYDPDLGIDLLKNPNYWKMGEDGQPLPYLDGVNFVNLVDATAVDTAYRGREIDIGGFPLSSVQVEAISGDFPDHETRDVAFGFTIVTVMGTFNPDWQGEDGLGNPYLDRRFAYAMQAAIDRNQLIDTVYLGAAKLSATHWTPWFDSFWKLPDDELLTVPGYRPDREADKKLANDLVDASGYDRSRPLKIFIPDIWEQTYPGVTEVTAAMYEDAVGFRPTLDIQPYTLMQARFNDGTFPGRAPCWTNPPPDLDPTSAWTLSLKAGGSSNLTQYDYPAVEAIVDEMVTTLDADERREMALTVQRIGMGIDPEHGYDGMFGWFGVMNGIAPTVWWPYVNRSEDTIQFAHDSHNFDVAWLDQEHADYPA